MEKQELLSSEDIQHEDQMEHHPIPDVVLFRRGRL